MSADLILLAAELRVLATQLTDGRLPDPGAATELGRRVDRAVKAARPRPRSGQRPKQVRELARRLGLLTGRQVTAAYEDDRRRWRLEWCDGPTAKSMRLCATELGGHLPSLVASLAYHRGASPRAQVAALLCWLDSADPADILCAAATDTYTWGDRTRTYSQLPYRAEYVHMHTEYPELLVEGHADRIAAIQRLAPDVDRRLGLYGEPDREDWLRLGEMIRRHGWPATRHKLSQQDAAGPAERPSLEVVR